MAVQTTEEFKNGGATSYAITIEYLKTSDIKVRIGGALQTYTTGTPGSGEYSVSGTTVTLGAQAAAGSGNVHIYRETDVDTPAAVFAAGSSIRATDLNAIHDMARFSSVEHRNQVISADIKDDQILNQHIATDAVNADSIIADAVGSSELADNAVDTAAIQTSAVTTNELATDSVNTSKIIDLNVTRAKLEADAIDSTKLADNSVNSEHYVDGSIDHVHLANDIIDGDNIQDDVVNSEHIAAGALDNEHYATGSITSDKLNGATVVTASEQAAAASNDTSFLTTAAADARFFNVSTGDTIKDGDSFPDNDTTIATTAAINDRIIDLVDDVGGFVPIANETSFPTANPDVNNGAGTVVSVASASTNLVPSGTTVTIANGRGSGLAVIITGVSATIPSGFGFLVETTTTAHTYTFHRLSPKTTEVTTVAGISGNVTTVAGIASDVTTVAGISSNVTAVAGNSTNINAVAGNATNINAVAADASDIGVVAADGTDIGLVAGSITNVNNVSGSIASVNTAASNLASINNFGDTYQVASSNPSTDGGGNALAEGDLYFNTTANELKVYNGSAWQGGVTASGNFASITGNSFSGDNTYVDNAKARFGTGQDLEIFHNANDSIINDTGQGTLKVQTGGSTKLEIQSGGVGVTGNITVSGNVDGRDVATDGTKLDGIEASATADQTVTEIKSLLASDKLTSDHLADQAVTLAKLEHGTSSNNGKFLRANNGADPTFETVNTDLLGDTTPQLGGTLDTNSQDVDFKGSDGNTKILWDVSQDQLELADSTTLTFGDHTGTGDYNISYVNGADFTILGMNGGSGDLVLGTFASGTTTKNLVSKRSTGAIEAYYGGSKKFETTTGGVSVTGAIQGSSTIACTSSLSCTGANIDNQIIINGLTPQIQFTDSDSDPDYKIELNGGTLSFTDTTAGATRLSLNTAGANVTGNIAVTGTVDGVDVAAVGAGIVYDTTPQLGGHLDCQTFNIDIGDSSGSGNGRLKFGNGDLQIYHDGTNSRIENTTGTLYLKDDYITFVRQADDSVSFQVYEGGATDLYFNHNKKFETTNTGVSITGALVASGDVTAFSDARLKTDIHTINDALGTVGKLRGVNYKWLKDGKQSTGLIAQEVEAVIPEVVTTNEELTVDGVKDVKSVDYGKLVGVLIEAVKDLKAEIDELKGAK